MSESDENRIPILTYTLHLGESRFFIQKFTDSKLRNRVINHKVEQLSEKKIVDSVTMSLVKKNSTKLLIPKIEQLDD